MPSQAAVASPLLLTQLQEMLGVSQVLTGPDADPFCHDWRGRIHGRALCVVRPKSVEQLQAVVRWAAKAGVAVVPQGGNTSLCGGATPSDTGEQVVVSLQLLNKIELIDPINDTMTVQAGCTLEAAQQAAAAHGRLFPLRLGSQGSCTIGGNVATNAGGVHVLRYGTMRDLVLGIEAVMPDGGLWKGLKSLRKDNTGYRINDVLIGSEGGLGIITRVTLKLFPQPRSCASVFLALRDMASLADVLPLARHGFGSHLSAFEWMSGFCLKAVAQQYPERTQPLSFEADGWYVLLEVESQQPQEALDEEVMRFYESVQSHVLDAVVASSHSSSEQLWWWRGHIPVAERRWKRMIKNDVAVPSSRLVDFVQTAQDALSAKFPGVQLVVFGHAGDGNLHFNLIAPPPLEADWLSYQPDVWAILHDILKQMEGTFSAEHGIGSLKAAELPRFRGPEAVHYMHLIKNALDPQGIMNPGKVLLVQEPQSVACSTQEKGGNGDAQTARGAGV